MLLCSVLFRSGLVVVFVWLIGLSFALTNLFFKEGLALYAITGGEGNILFSSVLFSSVCEKFL